MTSSGLKVNPSANEVRKRLSNTVPVVISLSKARERNGLPRRLALTPRQAHDSRLAGKLPLPRLDAGKGSSRRRPRSFPCQLGAIVRQFVNSTIPEIQA